jgi:hypothetical protein
MKPSKLAKAALESRHQARHQTRKRIVKGRVTENKGKKGKA